MVIVRVSYSSISKALYTLKGVEGLLKNIYVPCNHCSKMVSCMWDLWSMLIPRGDCMRSIFKKDICVPSLVITVKYLSIPVKDNYNSGGVD